MHSSVSLRALGVSSGVVNNYFGGSGRVTYAAIAAI